MKSFFTFMEEINPCWKGYKQVGTKKKNGKEVPNCVPVEESVIEESKYRENIGSILRSYGYEVSNYGNGVTEYTSEDSDIVVKVDRMSNFQVLKGKKVLAKGSRYSEFKSLVYDKKLLG